ncbi:MAG: AraC family transcriptional regulator [Pseudomonadales bacterium]|nr:AraC family transcriptional regulator [Pseudomonadales bacterium]
MLNHLFITPDAARFIAAFIQQQGIQFDALPKLMEQSESGKPLSFEQWWSLLDRLNQQLNIPALGVEIGKHATVEYFGCLGYLFKTSQTMAQAMGCFERFQRLLYDGNKAHLVIEGETTRLVWDAYFGYSSQLSDELLLASLLTVGRSLLQRSDLLPVRVDFTQTVQPRDVQRYLDFFQCEVLFDQPNLAIVFPSNYFALPIPGCDENLHQLLDNQARTLLQAAPDATQLASRILSVLVRCLQAGEPTADAVSRELNMSTRSLHRKLAEEGIVFRELLRDTRLTLARQYLADLSLSLPEIALMLGFSEQSAFSRAFKQWQQQSPNQYRRSLGKAGHAISSGKSVL